MHSREPHPPPGIALPGCRNLDEMRNTLQLLPVRPPSRSRTHFGRMHTLVPGLSHGRRAPERVRVQEATAQRYAGLEGVPTNPEPTVYKELNKLAITVITCARV